MKTVYWNDISFLAFGNNGPGSFFLLINLNNSKIIYETKFLIEFFIKIVVKIRIANKSAVIVGNILKNGISTHFIVEMDSLFFF